MLLAFLGFVVLLAGFVAYAADTIARRVGRRHLRLFGLRPKTTALIVAVASGMGISLASVLAFGLINRQAIANINQADKLRLELRDLKAGVSATRKQLQDVQGQRDSALAEAALLRSERNQAVLDRDQADREAEKSAALLERARQNTQGLRDQAQALSDQVLALAARRDELQATAQASQQDLSRTRAEAAALAAKVQQASAQVKALTASRDALAARVREAEAQLSAAQERLTAASARASDADARARNAEARLARVQASLSALSGSVSSLQASVQELQATRSSLQGQRDALSRELNSLKAVRDSLQRDNLNLQQGLSAAVAERDRLQADVQSVTSELSATRTGGLIYRRGDAVSSSVVASVLNLPDALRQAEVSAQARGARGNPAAYLPAALEDRLQGKLRALNTTALVTCRAASNTAAGYPVELSCDAVPNALLYRRGDVIRSAQITLAGNPEQLRVQLLDLQSAVLRDLSSRGVPPERVAEGGLTTAELLDLLSQLRGRPAGSAATVSIAAGSDLRPGSPVDLYALIK